MTRKSRRKRDTHLYMMCCCATSQFGGGDHWNGVMAISGTHHRLHSDGKKKKSQDSRDFFVLFDCFFVLFLIEPFLPLFVSYGHKWLPRIGAPAEANLSLPLKLWQSSLVAATTGNLFNCSTPLLYIFKRIMILLSFFLSF